MGAFHCRIILVLAAGTGTALLLAGSGGGHNSARGNAASISAPAASAQRAPR